MVRWIMASLLIFSGQVHAWGNLGHQTICEMAFQELTPTARSEVDRLIALDTRFETFADSCRADYVPQGKTVKCEVQPVPLRTGGALQNFYFLKAPCSNMIPTTSNSPASSW